MDQQTDISEVQHSERSVHNFHHVEKVNPKDFSNQELEALWAKVKTQDYAFDDLSTGKPEAFCLVLLDPYAVYFKLEDYGFCMVRGLFAQSTPTIHFMVWDRTTSGSRVMAAGKEIIDWVFSTYGCNRITAFCPEYNEQAKRFATLLRFLHEGTMKEAILYQGRWRHVNVMGLLKTAFYKGTLERIN